MIYLLDANLLIALIDQDHVQHQRAHAWASHQAPLRWATCPLIENAFVRITSNPAYPNAYPSAADALDALRNDCSSTHHVFWPDDISICDKAVWNESGLLSGRHLTDLYLLALAVKHGGKFASFDQRIPAHFVRKGREALHIVSA